MTTRSLRYGSFFCAALVIFFFAETLLTCSSYFAGDLTYYWWPRKLFIASQFQSGVFPLWDPTFRCGIPFFAIPDNGVLEPTSLVFNFFSFALGLKIFHALSFFATSFACFLIAKTFRWSNASSILLALLIAFGGYFIVRCQFLSQCSTLTWGIWAAIFLISGQIYCCIFPLAFMVFAGHWQTGIIFSMFCLSIFLFRSHRLSSKEIFLSLVMIIAVLGITAVQVLPTFELSGLSQWGTHGVDYLQATIFSLSPKDLLNILRAAPHNLMPNFDNSVWINSLYMGMIPVLLAFWGYSRLTLKAKIVSGLILITFVSLSFGDSFFVSAFLFKRLPFLSYLRYPSRWILGAALMIPILAAFGLEKIHRKIRTTLLILVLLPLAWNWWGFLPVIHQSYFREKNPFATTLQQKLSDSERFLFSFKTERLLRGEGTNFDQQARDLRDRLYVRTPLVYRLSQAGGFGEPLVPTRSDSILDFLRSQPTPDSAAPLLSRLGVSTILTAERWEKSSFAEDGSMNWILYANPNALPKAYWIDSDHFERTQNWSTARTEFARVDAKYGTQKVQIEGSAPQDNGWVILSDTFYPGWEAYSNGRKAAIRIDSEIFRAVQVPKEFRIDFIYRSALFFWGLIISLLACSVISVSMFRRIPS